MGCKAKKYLHIYDWNYWWGYYRCCKDWEPFHAAEFSLSEDEQERRPFSTLISITSLPFTRPFWTVSLWSRIIRIIRTFWSRQGGSEAVNRTGSSGRLYYPLFSPEMHFCNASVRSGVPLTQLLSPSVPPITG